MHFKNILNCIQLAEEKKRRRRKGLTRALLRLERTMNLLCHYREGGGREGRGGREGGMEG